MKKEIQKTEMRIAYLDIAKAILIIFVILGHIIIILNPRYERVELSIIQIFIYSFHMPAFFIVHGILFNTDKWRKLSVSQFVRKRIFTLIVPYLFFETIAIVWKAIFEKQSIYTGIFNMLTVRCNVGADWFLPALFLGSFLFLIFIKYFGRFFGVISVIIAFLLPFFMSGPQLTIVIGRGLLAYGFIMIGYAGRSYFQSPKTKSIIWILTALIITGITAFINFKQGGGNDFYTCTVKNPLILAVGGVTGTFLTLGISRLISSAMLSIVGRHSLTIMGTHQLAIYAMTALIPSIINGTPIWGFILLIVIIVFEIPLVYAIDKYLPYLVGKN